MTQAEEAQAVNVALAPCPFCGGKPALRRIVEEYEADSDGPAGEFDARFMICCDTCGIETGEEYRTEAIEAWNRRAAPALPPDVAALVERLQEHVREQATMGEVIPGCDVAEAASLILSQQSTIAEAEKVIGELLPAAEKVLEGLHARIDAANKSAVPVFYGISDLSDAINAARAWKER